MPWKRCLTYKNGVKIFETVSLKIMFSDLYVSFPWKLIIIIIFNLFDLKKLCTFIKSYFQKKLTLFKAYNLRKSLFSKKHRLKCSQTYEKESEKFVPIY